MPTPSLHGSNAERSVQSSRAPGKPLIALHEIATRAASLRRMAARTPPGHARDALDAEIALLEKLYALKLTTEPDLVRND